MGSEIDRLSNIIEEGDDHGGDSLSDITDEGDIGGDGEDVGDDAGDVSAAFEPQVSDWCMLFGNQSELLSLYSGQITLFIQIDAMVSLYNG